MIVHVKVGMNGQAGAVVADTDVTSATAVQDTVGKVAYAPKAGGPPDTSNYMWAGYAITFAAYGGYVLMLLRRMARARHAR